MIFTDLPNTDHRALEAIHTARLQEGSKPRYARYLKGVRLAEKLAAGLRDKLAGKPLKEALRFKDPYLSLAPGLTLPARGRAQLKKGIEAMLPWRKGPIEICGEAIESEWRSDLKWLRVRKVCGSLQGKVILDIGCNNGYYLYQAALQNPKFVLGIDPVIPTYLQFQFLQKFCPLPNVDFKLVGVDELIYFERVFDVVFCLGILYHHTDPIGILKKIFRVLRPGGLLIVESEGIDKEGSYFLLPQGTYLKTPGHWFIPTTEGLMNMIRRSGFQYVGLFLKTQLTSEEQRRKAHAPYDSLGEGLDPNDGGRTREGHPAPWRFYVKARRARLRR